MNKKWFECSKHVDKAIKDLKPVVALESTLIAQGLPYPKNIEVALAMEEEVKKSGAVPATIGIIKGVCKIGLCKDDIEYLGNGKQEVIKVGEGEIAYAIGTQKNAATTVSGTAWIAERFNIRVFATGGTGGVHKDANVSWDVSQDIRTMSHTPIIIVSSGAKSILDLEKTCEMMESHGILVLGYNTDSFPAFYSSQSDIKLSFRVNNANEVAAIYNARTLMKGKNTILVANPVPESEQIPSEEIDNIINQASQEAASKGIKGKALTPFLLANIAKRSEGKSMKTNIALLLNNAKLAGEIACEVSDILKRHHETQIGFQQI